MVKFGPVKTAFKSRSRKSGPLAQADHEARVSQYFKDYVESGKSKTAYMLRRPDKSAGALMSLLRLPCLHMVPSGGVEGSAILAALLRHSVLWRLSGLATAVLTVPNEACNYSLGAEKQTLRRKMRQAQRLGVHWRDVSDPQERHKLLQYANECEKRHPDKAYRNANPDNSEILNYQLWLVAYAADDRPVLLSVTPVDGEFALLQYFRTLGTGEEQSTARYLMTEVLVEHLASRGVRYLVDGTSLFSLTSGLRHFQQMVGFHVVRIRIGRPKRDNLTGASEKSFNITATGSRL